MLYENRQLVVCRKCYELHFEISRDEAFQEMVTFNEMFYNLTDQERKSRYNNIPSTLGMFEQCVKCGNDYMNFKNSSKVPYGKSATAIISRFE